jgi:hypothetical protein
MKKQLLPFLFVGTMLMIFVMSKTGATLKTTATSMAILDLEFAYNKTKVWSTINAWSPNAIVNNISKAKINTYLDFIFLTFYALFLFFLCKKIAETNKSNIGLLIAKGALVAGVLDILENIGMLISLSGNVYGAVAIFTTFLAALKFILLIAALLYVLIGGFLFIKKTTSVLL